MSDAAPDAASKLRTVLDYLPCEACLATPSPEQELLCSVCRRLDREVAVKFVTRTSVILERPTPVAAPEPVVIPPAEPAAAAAPPTPPPAPEAPAGPPPVEVLLRRRGLGLERRPGSATEVIVEPYEEPAPVAPVPEAPAEAEAPKRRGLFGRKKEAPAEAEAPAPVAAPEPEEEVEWEDVATFEGPADREDLFGYEPEATYERPATREPAPEPEPVVEPETAPVREPEPEPAAAAAFEEREDDFVFRAPEREEAPAQAVVEEDWMLEEEIPLEPPRDEANPWARPESEPLPEPVEEQILESEVVDEDEVLETEVVEDDEVLEMEIVPDEEPAPAAAAPAPPSDESDLWRLDAFDAGDREALRAQGIESIAHLSGHDAHELAGRTGRDAARLQRWIHVADLSHEAGIPIDHAKSLVAAGVAGPRALAEADAAELAKRLEGADITERELKRWKRRV